jgi:hypothetical protein
MAATSALQTRGEELLVAIATVIFVSLCWDDGRSFVVVVIGHRVIIHVGVVL